MNIEIIKEWFYNIGGVFIVWILIHYISANLYPMFCAEASIYGLIKSIFIAEAPHCVGMRWIIYNGGSVIHTMWISIGIWVSGKIFTNLLTK